MTAIQKIISMLSILGIMIGLSFIVYSKLAFGPITKANSYINDSFQKIKESQRSKNNLWMDQRIGKQACGLFEDGGLSWHIIAVRRPAENLVEIGCMQNRTGLKRGIILTEKEFSSLKE